MSKKTETPLMRQYARIKSKNPDAILLFRVGDFYETFGKDAIIASEILNIILTSRSNGENKLELAGFPYHSLNNYLPKLVKAGYRVAICDQLEQPSKDKKIVKRGVTELVTPGVSYNECTLEVKKNNFLACVNFEKNYGGVAFLDISTGEFLTTEGSINTIKKLLTSLAPKEIIYNKAEKAAFLNTFSDFKSSYFGIEQWAFSIDHTSNIIKNQFQINSLKGLGIKQMPQSIKSCGAILEYLSQTNHVDCKHINLISKIDTDKYMWLDQFTIDNLEIITPLHPEGKALINVIDATSTPMGSRLLKNWLIFPSKDKKIINEKHSIVELFKEHKKLTELEEFFSKISDLERLCAKIATKKIQPRELLQLKKSLSLISNIKLLLEDNTVPNLIPHLEKLNPCHEVIDKIEAFINSEAPALMQKGNVINKNISKEIDELRFLKQNSKKALDDIVQKEIEKTKISSLKIGFTNVFGFYLEVRNTFKDKVPKEWTRKQTLTQAERYITEELKLIEEKLLSAESRLLELEIQIYEQLIAQISVHILEMQQNAKTIAYLDCLMGFAITASKFNYCKPLVDASDIIDIKQGRHPVIENAINDPSKPYIANDIFLDTKTQQIIMITGPNMSGKSAILRQTALIVLMSQIGCYVPANTAKLGIIDRLYSRVGASDNISQGESTFMIEMNESATILNNLSGNSLILLDEIGRGTSTYDGISIAWSIAKYLHEHPNFKAKTLFATHYHELNDMANQFERIKNFNVSVKRYKQKIIFLRKLIAGESNHSFGIQVAKMAGVPDEIIKNATKLLKQLESLNESKNKVKETVNKVSDEEYQLSFYQLDDPTLNNIKNIIINTDINTLTPMEAMLKLSEIKTMISETEAS